jgi:hypothetical protein
LQIQGSCSNHKEQGSDLFQDFIVDPAILVIDACYESVAQKSNDFSFDISCKDIIVGKEIVSCDEPTYHHYEFRLQRYDEREQKDSDQQLCLHFLPTEEEQSTLDIEINEGSSQFFDLQTKKDCSIYEEGDGVLKISDQQSILYDSLTEVEQSIFNIEGIQHHFNFQLKQYQEEVFFYGFNDPIANYLESMRSICGLHVSDKKCTGIFECFLHKLISKFLEELSIPPIPNFRKCWHW